MSRETKIYDHVGTWHEHYELWVDISDYAMMHIDTVWRYPIRRRLWEAWRWLTNQ